MNREKILKRNSAMDLVRIVACFGVVSVHFLYNNGYYGQEIVGNKMVIMTFFRSFFMYCVPLFLVLSGYLMREKKVEGKYFKKIGKTYFIYVAASFACVYLYRILYTIFKFKLGLPDVAMEYPQFAKVIVGILNFTSAKYSWYIEMYIGLFFLIPFLNLMYNGLKTKRKKQLLILVFIALTALPSILNVYDFSTAGWWADPTLGEKYVQIIPAWWTGIYPLTYYFIGCYLGEYGLKIKKRYAALLTVLSSLIYYIYLLWRSHGGTFKTGAWTGWGSFFITIITLSLFVFLMNLKCDKLPYAVKWSLAKLSDLCLGIYLVSWIFDNLFYPVLAAKVPDVPSRLPYYFIIVPAVFACSAVVSYVILKLYRLCSYLWGRFSSAVRKAFSQKSAAEE
ncbi:MAG: acyltransferase family protein [Clostridia bacterium]|nr:acyltransferase family protein [Clostridia bacterium]